MPRGGARKGAGRKPKAAEEKSRQRLLNALRKTYKNELDEDNLEAFLCDFLPTRDGMKFFAEHLIGKAPDRIDHTSGDEPLDITPFQITIKKPEE